MSHIPEPWSVFPGHRQPGIDGNTGASVAIWGDEDEECGIRGATQEEALANAERIVACVNACAGINPEAVPKLLSALKTAEAALSDIGDATRESGDDLAWCERRAAKDLPAIRAAIKTATGGQAQ